MSLFQYVSLRKLSKTCGYLSFKPFEFTLQWWRCVKIAGKSGFSTYLFDFVGVFCKESRLFCQNIVDNEVKLRYYET